jgi:PAS domain S-box-containing protein
MKDQSKTKQSTLIQKRASLDEASEYAENIINTVRESLIVLDQDLRVVTASRSFYEFFKVKPEETEGQLIYNLGNEQWDIPKLRELLENILPQKVSFDNYEVEHDFATIGRRVMLLNARQIKRALGKERIILLAIEDITERKQLESLLIDSEELYRHLFETASDGIVFFEQREGRITHINPAAEKMLGYTKKESIGNKLQDIGVSLDMGDFPTTIQNLDKSGIIHYNDVPVKTKSGHQIDTDIYLVDRATLVQCSIRDVTERKWAEEELRKSEENFRLSLDDSPLGVRIVTEEGKTLYANQTTLEIYGYDSIEELRGTFLKNRYTLESYAEFKVRKEKRGRGEFGPNEYEINIVRKNGEVRHVQVFRKAVWWNGARQFQLIYQDITDRKQAEAKLRQQTDAMDAAIDGMAILNAEGEYVYLNKAHAKVYGYENAGELIGKSWRILYDSDVIQYFDQEIMPEFSRKGDWHGETIGTKKNGSKFPQELSLTAMANGGLICVVRDITERKREEEALRQSNEQYRLLADNVNDVIFVLDMNLNYTYVSPSVKILRGFEPAEILKLSLSEILTPASWDLVVKTLSEVMELEKSEHKEVRISRTLQLEVWRKDGTTVWTEVKLSVIRDENQQPVGIMGVTRDITERRKAEAELQQTLDNLKKAVSATIQVMVSAVEIRDPYTAGHQVRVADLARAIATEMGLPQEKIDGILMAGSIHDIGKLSVPAEILSKPTKLTDLEFSLIKEHSRIGYEMLKDVESPWPLAEIVYQHHERMNGSGYPINLKGDEILIEARIMAVADVVEAMASHRPYRPALGIEPALEEIEKNKGILYDDAVADACLRLFREKGFQLKVA